MEIEELEVSHLMTRNVVTLHATDALPAADELMRQERIRHLPVVDHEGRLVGLVTHRDLLRAQVGAHIGLSPSDRAELQLHVPVQRVMRRVVWTVRPDQSAVSAARLLVDLRFGCAPVVDEERRVVGIVTEADFLHLAGTVFERWHDVDVSSVMTPTVVTLHVDEELPVAEALMGLDRIRHVPVVDDDGKVCGLVTHRDLMQARRSALSDAPAYPTYLHVRDVMKTDVFCVQSGDPAAAAAVTLDEQKIGCLLVVEQDRLVGIVTEADFLRTVAGVLEPHHDAPRHDAPVNYYMTEPATVVRGEDEVAAAQETMTRLGLDALGVVDDDGALCGVLSRSDLLRASRRGRWVREMATGFVHAVGPDTTVVSAAATMVAHAVHRVFVIAADGRPLGVLRTSDLAAAVRDFELETPVGHYGNRPLFTIDVHEPVAKARALIDVAGLSGVIVRQDSWPVGYFGQEEALATLDVPEQTEVGHVMSQQLVCVPSDLPLYRVAGQVAALGARRVIVMSQGYAASVVGGMDFARALAAAG